MIGIISQTGLFEAGTYGKIVEVDIQNYPQTGIFAGLTSLTMDLIRPDGSAITARALTLPGAVLDQDGKLQWTVVNGDFTISGIYTLKMHAQTASSLLNFSGDFKVV
jgi:hypothetical protein